MKTAKILRDDSELAADDEIQQTLDAIPHAIAVVGPDGRTLGVNAFVLAYTGLGEAQS